MIVPSELRSLDLQDDTETEAFLKYRLQLIQSICIGCNFPYDLLISDNSNRSVSEVAQEELNKSLVKPLQKRVLRQLKRHLKVLGIFTEELVDSIEFEPVDINNEKEVMEVVTGYKKAGIIDANEARGLSPYELGEREDGNELTTTKESKDESNAIEIEKSLSSRYSKDNLQKIKKAYVQEM